MKFRLLASLSAAALLVSVASTAFAGEAAKAGNTGALSDAFAYISGGGMQSSASSGGGSQTGPTVEGGASMEYDFTPMIGAQGDVVYRTQQWTYDPYTVDEHDFEAAAHLFTRSERYLLGGFFQYGDGGATIENSIGVDFTHIFGGVEGQLFVNDNATLYGQVGGKRYDVGGQSMTGYFGTFEARYYLQPNFKVAAHIAAETLSSVLFTGSDETTYSAGLDAEYRFDNTPFSVFARYDYSQNNFSSGSANVSGNRILAGIKFNFDAPTLLDRDRHGASLKPLDSHDFDWGITPIP